DMLHHFLTAVETSDELLGDKPLTIDAAEVAPMVQNWIKDYNYWPTENKFRQSIDAVNYASKAPNPQKLAAEDRALLIKLLGWYDEIRNSLYDYEASEDIDLEQYPNFDPRLLTASIDEFESPESARKALDKALAVKRSNPLAGIPVTGSARSERFIPTAMPSSSNAPRPNIQGVLSNAPIKKEDGTSKGVAPVIQGKPRVAPLTPLESQKPSPAPASTAPSAPPKNKPVALPVSSAPSPARPVLPARAPENLPMVEPEDLPAVRLPKIPSRPAKKTSTSFQGAASSVPVTLNMDRIQDEVKRNKIAAQADIDERLANLKKRSTSKN
ncbi:MAG: hypothetical protein JNK33_04775, partial [Candidatus Doudnabacteria bacterium]|nr:hypothetical protein [Candidatus Doudnabacteria bacterium]